MRLKEKGHRADFFSFLFVIFFSFLFFSPLLSLKFSLFLVKPVRVGIRCRSLVFSQRGNAVFKSGIIRRHITFASFFLFYFFLLRIIMKFCMWGYILLGFFFI